MVAVFYTPYNVGYSKMVDVKVFPPVWGYYSNKTKD